jgi:hypothetical protein
MWERNCVWRVLVWRPEGKTPFGVPVVGGKIILKWAIKKYKRTA